MKKKFFIKTLGCQMNDYDSLKIKSLLIKNHGYLLSNQPEEADVLLLNTCSIREKAKEKLYHQLGRWSILKKNNPNLIIGVGGCVSSQEGDNIFKRNNNVNIVFGPQTIFCIPDMLDKSFSDPKKKIIDISFSGLKKFNYLPLVNVDFNPVASVSIMEGCSKYCSFCVVPYTRGKEISRSCNDILLEIRELANNGVREINLLGQNVNSYRGVMHNNDVCSFARLLKLISSVKGIDRIRFISSHPKSFTDDIIDVYKDVPELVNHVHLPVQSGSDKILSLMRRFYTTFDYKNIICKLRNIRSQNFYISSDFIVGFPGETNNDFLKTMDFISEINFDMSYSFIYSPRPGTRAFNMVDNLSVKEKKDRLLKLQNLINIQAMNFNRKMYGSIVKVLVEGVSKKNNMYLFGRTENNKIVYFEGDRCIIGKFVDIKIIDVNLYFFLGVVLSIEKYN